MESSPQQTVNFAVFSSDCHFQSGAAFRVVAVASFKPVQMGLGAAAVLPLPPLQRAARAAKRAGAKNIDVIPR